MSAFRFLVASLLSVVAPVPGPVVQRFVAPACQRCAGHRGVTIASAAGDPVRTPVAGTVAFAGAVAGRNYVVVVPSVRSGAGAAMVKVAIGWMVAIESGLAPGTRVAEGQRIGTAGETTHLSVRVNGTHVEPLAAMGLGWARLRGPGGVLVGRGPLPR